MYNISHRWKFLISIWMNHSQVILVFNFKLYKLTSILDFCIISPNFPKWSSSGGHNLEAIPHILRGNSWYSRIGTIGHKNFIKSIPSNQSLWDFRSSFCLIYCDFGSTWVRSMYISLTFKLLYKRKGTQTCA